MTARASRARCRSRGRESSRFRGGPDVNELPPDVLRVAGVKNADGKSYLDIDQPYPNGSVCEVNRAYSEESTGGQVLLSESYDISNRQHHLALYYDKIDGGKVNVLNSVLATTTTVPDVIGLTAAHAEDAIQAAGPTAVTTYVNAAGLPGTVVNQNPPGETIDPAGSPVQITVTRGVFAATDQKPDRPRATELAKRTRRSRHRD